MEFAVLENVRLYLVGGTVRDFLLGKEVEDLDFAVAGDALSFARKFANRMRASFVSLDEEHDTARVTFRSDHPYMDFCGMRGAGITEDLSARDFTVNAMAVDFSQIMNADEAQVIDPHGGVEDLNNGLIRIVAARNVKDDPVRMLRAYRFAAILDFTIDDATSIVIRDSAGLLDSVAVERIRDELLKTFAADNAAPHLKAMDDVGLLEQIFPEIAPMKGMEQNDYHHLDVWEHSTLTLEFLEHDPLPDSLTNHASEVEDYLKHESVKGRPRLSLLKLAALLHDAGKPARKTIDSDGRIRFFDHNLHGAEIITSVGKRLKLANREILSLKDIIKNHMYPLGLSVFLLRQRGAKGKDRAIRRFINKTKSEWLAILLLSFADLRATQGPRRNADDLDKLTRLIGEIADMRFRETRSPMPKLVTGSELMKEFALPASPTIGRLLKQVKKAQINGAIKSRDDAVALVRNILSGR